MENEDKAIEILKGKKFSTIGNLSYNDAFDAIIEMAEYKDAQRRTPSDDTTEGFVHQVIGEVACHETDLQRQIEQGKAFAEHNKTVFEVAMAVAKFYDEQLKLRMDAYERERKALTEVEKLKQELAAFKDETPITTEFLNKNFSFVDSDDSDGIWAALYDNDPYYAKIQIDTDCHNEGFKVICEKGVYYAETVGQLKMFLTLCGVQDFAKQLKE